MTDAVEVMIAPTMERLRHVRGAGVDVPVVDRRVSRKAWRIVHVVETMHRAGKIDDRRWGAWERFERDWDRASYSPSLVARYGAAAGVGGTPVSQMSAMALTTADVGDNRRLYAIERTRDALLAVMLPRLQQALVMVVSEQCTLDQIGARISRYTQEKQRAAVAAAAIEDGLWLLYQHYQTIYGQAQKSP